MTDTTGVAGDSLDWDAEPASFDYDPNGNLIAHAENSADSTLFDYDHRNLPLKVTLPDGGSARFRYTADGQRYLKEASGEETFYILDGPQTLAVMKEDTLRWWNITGQGIEGRRDAESDSLRYYLKDHLGSTRVVVDNSGEVLESFDYYPFGLLMPKRNTTGAGTMEKFTGKERDEAIALDYFGARYYDPALGRWHGVDPLASERPGLTPYNYVQNNPLIRVDPTGLLDDYYIREDGNIDVIRTDDETDTFYYVDGEKQTTNLGTFEKNENGLIQLPGSHSVDENGVSFGFRVKPGEEDVSYINPEAFAAVLGAFAETGYSDFTITQFSNSDGSSPAPSISHVNGRNGDFRYLRTDGSGNPVTVFDNQFDGGRNVNFTNALSKYGYSDLKSYHIPTPYRNAVALPNTSHLKGHHNHLHLQGFRPKINTTFYPYIR